MQNENSAAGTIKSAQGRCLYVGSGGLAIGDMHAQMLYIVLAGVYSSHRFIFLVFFVCDTMEFIFSPKTVYPKMIPRGKWFLGVNPTVEMSREKPLLHFYVLSRGLYFLTILEEYSFLCIPCIFLLPCERAKNLGPPN